MFFLVLRWWIAADRALQHRCAQSVYYVSVAHRLSACMQQQANLIRRHAHIHQQASQQVRIYNCIFPMRLVAIAIAIAIQIDLAIAIAIQILVEVPPLSHHRQSPFQRPQQARRSLHSEEGQQIRPLVIAPALG